MWNRITQLMVCFTFLIAVGLVVMAPYTGPSQPTSMVTSFTADGSVSDGSCAITAINIMTDGANNCTVELENGNGGTDQYKITVLAADYYGGRNWTYPLYFDSDGCYMNLTTGGTATVWVEYLKQ